MKDAPARPALGVLYITLANILGGSSFSMQVVALEGLEPGMIATVRHLIALPLLWGWCLVRGWSPAALSRRELWRVFLLGTVAFGAPLVLGITGVGLASASNGAILVLIEPVTILIFAWLLLGERIRASKVAGVLLGLVGAAFIVLETAPTAGLFRGDQFLGNAMLVTSALLWGLYTPLVRPLSRRHDTIGLSTLTIAFSLVLLLPLALWELRTWEPNEALVRALWWTLALGLGVSFVTTVFWVGAVRHLEASRIAPFVFLQPVVGVLLGVLLLEERLTTAAIAGGLLVAAGCWLALRGSRQGEPTSPPDSSGEVSPT